MKKLISLVLAVCLLLTLTLSFAYATDVDENAGTTVTADGSVISTNPAADGSAGNNGTAADGTAQAGTTVTGDGAAVTDGTAPASSVINADGSVSNADGSLTFPGADSQQAGTAADGAGTAVNPGAGITTVTTSTGSDSATVTTDAGTAAGTADAGTTAAGTTAAGTADTGTTSTGTTSTGATTSGTASTGTTNTANTGTAGPIEGAVSGSAAASSGLTHYPASGKTRQKNVIMRKEADSKSKKVVTFSKKGQELTVTGEETVDGVLWYAVTSPKGKEGYVQGIYVSVEEADRINAVKKSAAPKKMEVTIEASCADYQGLGKTWTKQYEINGIELADKGSVVEMAEGVEFSYLTCLVNKNANGISKEAYAPTAGDLTSGFTRTQNMIAVSKKGKQVQWSITFTFMPEGTAAAAKAAARAEAAQTSSNGTSTTTTVKKANSSSAKKTTATSTRKEVVTYQLDAASDKPAEAVVREIDHYEDREMEVTERVQTGTKTYYAYETDEKGKSVMVEKTKPVYKTQTVRKVVSVPVYKDELPAGYTSSSSSSAAATTTAAAATTTTAAEETTTPGTTATTETAADTTVTSAVPEADDLEEETVTETVTETVETVPAAATETVPAATTTETTETVATTTTETAPAAATQTTETVATTTTVAETIAATTTAEAAPAAAGAVKTKDQLAAEYSLMFFGPVNNDATGNLRVAQYFAAATQEQFARDYYYAYFTNDNEIHALISPMTQTTAKISVFGGSKLLVVIYSYVNGEESNAAALFTGNMVGAWQIDLATGETVNMMPAG